MGLFISYEKFRSLALFFLGIPTFGAIILPFSYPFLGKGLNSDLRGEIQTYLGALLPSQAWSSRPSRSTCSLGSTRRVASPGGLFIKSIKERELAHALNERERLHALDERGGAHALDEHERSHALYEHGGVHALDEHERPHALNEHGKPHALNVRERPNALNQRERPHACKKVYKRKFS